ncbi:MAG TPA: hypothetical protein VFR06_02540 [Gallionellaceae bacterium]|nr:hypothetical protein [Gallionellaceae bacterium]
MDERTLKRLIVITVAAIAIVLLAKFMLTKTVSGLSKAAAARKQGSLQKQPPAVAPPVIAPASGVVATEPTASAVVEINAR